MKKLFLIIALALPTMGVFASNNSSQVTSPKNEEQEATYRIIMTSCGTKYTVPASISDQRAADLCLEFDEADCG